MQANPSMITIHVTIYGPVLAECLKDGSTPVRLAAERCALHALQLTKGISNIYIYIVSYFGSFSYVNFFQGLKMFKRLKSILLA